MWNNLYQPFGVLGPGNMIIFAFLMAWSTIWKGIALWKSAREGSKIWFVVFLVLNTLGILEILYLYVFSAKDFGKGSNVSAKSESSGGKEAKEGKDEKKKS